MLVAVIAVTGVALCIGTGEPHWLLTILFALVVISSVLYFFRDPDRDIPEGQGIFVSPADGRIVEIADRCRFTGFESTYRAVSIFLSLWDVHVNRIPVSGTVGSVTHHQGPYHPAFSRTSPANAQNCIQIQSEYGICIVKQIAGFVARRVICTVQEGERVIIGQKFGRIIFGSRVELYLPEHVDIKVRVGQRVMAGQTIIAEACDED